MSKEKFIEIYNAKIHRPGAAELLDWLQSQDFFTAPASSRFHLCRPGGLVEHSLNVYDRLLHFIYAEYPDKDSPYSAETLTIVGLLHDICKVNMYEPGYRNQKTYDPEKVAAAPRGSVKHDQAGDFIWETVPSYTVEEKFIYGHGEKSVYIIRSFMQLSPAEAVAIRYHMGSWNHDESRAAGDVFSRYPLAFFLHIADEAASFLDESEE